MSDSTDPSTDPSDPGAAVLLRDHLRTWGLIWVAVGTGVLLIGTTAWVLRGIASHHHELADIHATFLRSHIEDRPLEEQLHELRPLGARSLSVLDPDGVLSEVVGDASIPGARASNGPVPIGRGRYLLEHPLARGTLVVEYHPMLAVDLRNRARNGLLIAVFASVLLVVFVGLWIRYRSRLEALRLEAERTRHLAQLGTLSAVIAHELRNPLTVLMGHAQLLAEDLPENRSARRVDDGANRLNELLDSLLTFAKTGDVVREPTDPVALVQLAAEEAGVANASVEGQAPPWSLDPTRVRQALVNLFKNALEASPDTVRATVGVDHGVLVIEVRDRGAGIPEGMHETIFEAFHTTRTQGTGLGLAVSRAIAEKHGGTLTAHGAPGGGALFRMRIPR